MRDRGSSVYFRSGQARSWGVLGSSPAAPCCGWTQGLKELSHNRVAATLKRSVTFGRSELCSRERGICEDNYVNVVTDVIRIALNLV